MNQQEISTLWTLLGQTWGAKFFEQYGSRANEAWSAGLASIPAEQAKGALFKLIGSGTPFPPTLPEFMALAKGCKKATVHPILTYERPPMTDEQVEARRREMYAALGKRIPGGR